MCVCVTRHSFGEGRINFEQRYILPRCTLFSVLALREQNALLAFRSSTPRTDKSRTSKLNYTGLGESHARRRRERGQKQSISGIVLGKPSGRLTKSEILPYSREIVRNKSVKSGENSR